MKLDSQQDQALLLQLLSTATTQVSHVYLVAELIEKIQKAEVESPQEA